MPKRNRRTPWKPNQVEIAAASNKTIPDVIAPGLRILFCGINPSLYSAAIGHHFGRPGNRFWRALYLAGLTERLLSPFEDRELLKRGYGITNLVDRATASADEMRATELNTGANVLERKVRRYKPSCVAFVGITAYRTAFGRKDTSIGPQAETLETARIWVLPNPSGLNAHYQLTYLVKLYRELHSAIG